MSETISLCICIRKQGHCWKQHHHHHRRRRQQQQHDSRHHRGCNGECVLPDHRHPAYHDAEERCGGDDDDDDDEHNDGHVFITVTVTSGVALISNPVR